jgi:uncharacterized protein (TIGR03000 family)
MSRTYLFLAGLLAVAPATGSEARAQTGQGGKVVEIEVWLPANARLFIEGKETFLTGSVRFFTSPPLPDGKYVYTFKAVVPGPKGPRVIARQVDVRPGDFEMVDLRLPRDKEGQPDCRYDPTPQEAVDAMLKLAKVTRDDVVWDLGCGDGRIPVTAAKRYGCKARGFDMDPERIKDSLANVKKNGVGNLVTIEQKDIFRLDLSKEPTVVTLYLLPRLNAKLLPQLRKLPRNARVVSHVHRMGDIRPDAQMTVNTDEGPATIYLWTAETIRRAVGAP